MMAMATAHCKLALRVLSVQLILDFQCPVHCSCTVASPLRAAAETAICNGHCKMTGTLQLHTFMPGPRSVLHPRCPRCCPSCSVPVLTPTMPRLHEPAESTVWRMARLWHGQYVFQPKTCPPVVCHCRSRLDNHMMARQFHRMGMESLWRPKVRGLRAYWPKLMACAATSGFSYRLA